jgi:hypothetical protein
VVYAIINGCAAAIPYAIEGLQVAGQMGAFNSSSSSSNLVIGKEIESFQMEKYIIKRSDGFKGKEACVHFTAYKNGRLVAVENIYFEKKNPEDMKMMNDFNQMNEMGKKNFIKERFMKVAHFDLGPIETEKAEAEKTESSKTISSNLPPVMGFR